MPTKHLVLMAYMLGICGHAKYKLDNTEGRNNAKNNKSIGIFTPVIANETGKGNREIKKRIHILKTSPKISNSFRVAWPAHSTFG